MKHPLRINSNGKAVGVHIFGTMSNGKVLVWNPATNNWKAVFLGG